MRTSRRLGGAKFTARKSGVGDLEVADDRECIGQIQDLPLTSNCEETPPIRPTTDPVDRMDEELLDIVPESPRHPYNMYDLIERNRHDGEYFDIKPKWAKTIITCFARFAAGRGDRREPADFETDSRDKSARFVNLCDAFSSPVLHRAGFMVGTKVEQEGIIRHGAKMLYAVSRATVPKITVVIRKAYGAGYYVMNGRAYEPDLIVAWPGAEISAMGAEGAVNIIFRKIEAAEDPEATRKEMVDNFKKIIDPYRCGQRHGGRHHRPSRDAATESSAGSRRPRTSAAAAMEEARRDAGVKSDVDRIREVNDAMQAGDLRTVSERLHPDVWEHNIGVWFAGGGGVPGRVIALLERILEPWGTCDHVRC